MKTCTKCGETKPLSEFYIDRAKPDGKRNFCSTCDKEKSKNYREKFPEKSKDQVRSSKLKIKYNIDLLKFKSMVQDQENKCAICKKEFWDPRYTCVDHCHTTGKVREILCGPCNTGLGLFKESEETILNALKYLKKHKLP
jgi:hypothetical protein